jgi:hypothetical protein
MYPTRRLEGTCQIRRQPTGIDPAFVMTAFPPGIGEVEMVSGDRARLDQVSDDTASVAVQHAGVGESCFLGGSLCPAGQARGAFKPKEVAIRVARRTRDEKRAPTAADLDLHWAVVTEHRVPRYGPENEARLIPWRAPGLLHQLVSEYSDTRCRHGICEPEVLSKYL